ARDHEADRLDLLAGAAARHRVAIVGAAVAGVELEVAAPRPGRLRDQRERLGEERLELALRAEVEQARVEIALATHTLGVLAQLVHGDQGATASGRRRR